MLHYHGTPITPRTALATMPGRHFCVSFMAPHDLKWCLQHGASVMLDNGAFSAWTRGISIDWQAFYDWCGPVLRHPHWAVLPDVIDGDEEANDALLKANPLPRQFVAPVWHLHESLDRLRRLADEWPRLCFGSSGAYATPGNSAWVSRIEAAWELLEKSGRKPWVHMLRAMKEAGQGPWPFRVSRQHQHCQKPQRQQQGASPNTRTYGAQNRCPKPKNNPQQDRTRQLVLNEETMCIPLKDPEYPPHSEYPGKKPCH